ncbi:protein arginine N-methyltransferase 7 [Cylas formicarius]|uniref:protein arginine N-methyltransferase 7 n=1 Tax=Cylas formicarius TaxID=197179 RepID=UPI002958D447|nr:protein arginine N-methyltransferase 7 [Cylas formicarius]
MPVFSKILRKYWHRTAFSNVYCVDLKPVIAMSTFVERVNPITGAKGWIMLDDDYDFHQEVARSAFADMLHDTERNEVYEKALKAAIDKMHAAGKKANVLDIGTGTGLLSMMAARHNADTITACEAFKPMSECARKIIKCNGFEGKIMIIPKRSTELTVGESGDLQRKCNILVTEVFDTELIGEGALSTFRHAHLHLLDKDCLVVPTSATIFAQVVECPAARDWNKPKDVFNDDLDLLMKTPESVVTCAGSAAVHDVQLSQLSRFNAITSPEPVLRFDWSGRTPFVYDRSTITSAVSQADGTAQMVFMWWELQMDADNRHVLSCAPTWARRGQEKPAWRDHWMQAIYYLPREVAVRKGQEINLISCHDEYSLWFNVATDLKISNIHYSRPVCECGLHVAASRTRIGQMNDTKRNKKYLKILEKHVDSSSVVLLLSDGFFLGLAASKLGARKLYCYETNRMLRPIWRDYVKTNQMGNVEILAEDDDPGRIASEVTLVLGEPYFSSSILPWDNLYFLYLLNKLKGRLSGTVKIFPQKCTIKGVPVRFEDLYKIRAPLGLCEGFDVKPFDDLIEESSGKSDANVEPQPLWEYPCVALGPVVEMASIDMHHLDQRDIKSVGTFVITENEECNGIALWVEWHIESPTVVISTGPTEEIVTGRKITWDVHTRQGVSLFPSKTASSIPYELKFKFEEGDLSFVFS